MIDYTEKMKQVIVEMCDLAVKSNVCEQAG